MDLIDASFHIPAHVLATAAGDEIAMLDIQQDRYLSLNKSGAKIWQFLTDGLTGQQIIDRLSEEFGVERVRLEQDLLNLLNELIERGMIEVASDTPE